MTDLSKSITRLERWFVDDALPLWAASGYDHRRGGFYETLDFDGNPITGQLRRVRVQARQIHTFSQAGLRGWHNGAEALAAKGFDYFLTHACPDDGARGCVHTLSDDGKVLDPKRDLYDQAFLLLTCASRWEATKDERALALAEKTLAFLDNELASPHGGWHESDQQELPRRQNPHMHLFEAFMALYRVTGNKKYLAYVESIRSLFEEQFLDCDTNSLREFFCEKLNPATGAIGQILEPGHMMEWVWLFKKYYRLTSQYPHVEMPEIFLKAQQTGTDPKSSFLVDSVVDDAPSDRFRRLWPQTEYIKACLALTKQGETGLGTTAATLIDSLFMTYLDQPVPGLWCDQYNGDGAPIARYVPASILYHLFEAVAEAVDYQEGVSA